ncbi:MAG: ABC transporter permease [bacterium]|nr:ABC transporter permease [bacterium]
MKFRDWLRAAFIGIWVNRTRAILAIGGIFIGIASVIALTSLGSGAREEVLRMIKELGANAIWVSPGYDPIKDQQGEITLDDVKAIKKLSYVESVTPMSTIEKVVKREKIKDKVSIEGVTSDTFSGEGVALIKGRLISELDIRLHHCVCILGEDKVKIFFGKECPLGKTIRIGGEKFLIIGVVGGKDIGLVTFGGWVYDKIFVPITVAFKMNPNRRKNLVDALKVRIVSSTSVEDASSFIVDFLKRRHRNAGKYMGEPQETLITTYTQTNQTLTLVGVAIACISLLVGGIGIMNMMLTSVLERRKEIGIRKAIGAKRRDIMGQFLIEAITISMIGGLLGIGGGALMANIAAMFIKIPVIISLNSIIIAVGFAVVVGISSGIYPAYKASRLDPIVALRYE